jgi:FkbM family methyltransferase
MCNLYSITTNQAAIVALFSVINRYVGNLPPMPGVFPDYPAPVVRNTGAERELVMMRWGMPPPPKVGGPPITNIRNTSSTYWRGWLKPEMVRVNSFAEYATEPNPETKKNVVWDIGANLGLFALPAALKVRSGRVYAFEPDLELACNLIRSLRLSQNRNLKLSVMSVAISNEDAAAAFQISKFSRALNKLESVGKWRETFVVPEQTRSVPTMRIDTLARSLAAPTVLKIDVEGAEMQVLHGGEQTIATARPNILIECESELQDPMAAFFEKHRYVLLDGEAEARSPLQRPVWNTIAIPNEKIAAAHL